MCSCLLAQSIFSMEIDGQHIVFSKLDLFLFNLLLREVISFHILNKWNTCPRNWTTSSLRLFSQLFLERQRKWFLFVKVFLAMSRNHAQIRVQEMLGLNCNKETFRSESEPNLQMALGCDNPEVLTWRVQASPEMFGEGHSTSWKDSPRNELGRAGPDF